MVWTYLHLNDPKHWQMRAREARVHIDKITDFEARHLMLEIAGCYERLAKRAEWHLVSDQQMKI